MPATSTTPIHGVHFPTSANNGTDFAAGLATGFGDLDGKLTPFSQGLLAARPAAGKVGRRYYATDVGANGTEYVDIGAAWVAINSQDAAANVPSLRTLGTGAAQAAAGNDSRLSDSRAPTGSAGGDLTGTYPNPTVGANKIDASKIATALKGGAAASTEALRALGTTSTTAAAGDDSRIPTQGENDALVGTSGTPATGNKYVTDADPRVPTQGENDALAGSVGTPSSSNKYITATDPKVVAGQAAGTASIRPLGTGATDAAAGNDSRLSNTRTPTDGTVTTAKIVDANVTKAKLATDSLNAFLKLATAADLKVKFGTANGNFNAVSGRSQCSFTLAHGLGVTPLFFIGVGVQTAAITEDGGATAHPFWVSSVGKDSTNIVLLAEIYGTSNNGCYIAWMAIG